MPPIHEREGIRIHPYPVFAGWIPQQPRISTMSSPFKPGAPEKATVAAAEAIAASHLEGDQPPQTDALFQEKQIPTTIQVNQKGFEPSKP